MQKIKNIYVLIGLVIMAIIIVAVSYYSESQKPTSQQINYLQAYLNNSSKLPPIDLSKLQKVKDAFPVGFPLPKDADINYAKITDKTTSPKYNIPIAGKAEIRYTTQEDTSQILETYSSAIQAQGLTVSGVNKNTVGQEAIHGYHSEANKAGDYSTPSGEISVVVLNMPNGTKNVHLTITR